MNGIMYRGLAVALALLGVGLILNSMTISGIVALSSGIGLWMADFHLEPAADPGPRRLVAKGSPALLLLPLMLSAGKVYTVTTDSLSAQYGSEDHCELTHDAGPVPVRKLLRML